jgi:excinuclease ABC subunit C
MESPRESPCLIPSERLEAMLDGLPRRPGVYLMKDAQGRVAYVGKAGVLRNRVRSYFRSQDDLGPKVRAMVARVADFEYIVTASEKEALLLESNLLKEHRPRYNIKLRDDKQYLYLKVATGARFPRVYTTRRVAPDGARYFGPYTNAQALRGTIKQLQRLFQFRTCTLDMEKEYRRPCLLFHIKRCSGPCIRAVTPSEYDEAVRHLILFLEGKHEEVLGRLRQEMDAAAESLSFERAAALRDRIAAAEKVAERQRVTTVGRGDLDAIAFAAEDGEVAVQVFAVRDDKIVNREEFVLQDAEGATSEEILTQFVQQYYDRATYVPPTILIPHPVESPAAIESWLTERRDGRVHLQVPHRGAKRQLLDLVQQNAAEAMERLKLKWLADERKTRGAMRELGEALSMPDPPRRIECYDISHIQGTSVVASMVVFEDGQPARHAYRRFRIKAGDQNDDFASMHEVISRRFRRALAPAAPAPPSGAVQETVADPDALAGAIESARDVAVAERTGEVPADAGEAGLLATEDAEGDAERDADGAPGGRDADRGGWTILPDLVIIDGGKGQLGAALEAMKDVDAPPLTTVGLAKEREEIFRPGYSEPLLLPRTSQALYLIQRVRDEAHRFAVTYHRLVRNKRMVGSKLDGVSGVGPKRKKALLQRFGTVSGIRDASDEEILAVPGINDSILAQLREQL